MDSIKNILPRVVKKAGVAKQVEASMVVNAFAQVVRGFLSSAAEKKAKALYLKDKTLTVACLSSVVAQELQLHQKKVINQVNKIMGEEIVEKLRFLS